MVTQVGSSCLKLEYNVFKGYAVFLGEILVEVSLKNKGKRSVISFFRSPVLRAPYIFKNDHHNPLNAQMFNYKLVPFHISVPIALNRF